MLNDVGLEQTEVWAIDVLTVFRNFDDYWSPFLGRQGPAPGYCMSLSDDRRARLRNHLQATLPVASDGTITSRHVLSPFAESSRLDANLAYVSTSTGMFKSTFEQITQAGVFMSAENPPETERKELVLAPAICALKRWAAPPFHERPMFPESRLALWGRRLGILQGSRHHQIRPVRFETAKLVWLVRNKTPGGQSEVL